MTVIGVVVAGAIGAPARFLVDSAVRARGARRGFGTLVVNLTGSLLLGLITGLALYHGFPKAARIVLGVGFCGSYTTFSTFTYELLGSIERGATGSVLRSAATSLLGGTLAAAVGLGVMAAW